jgi:hypothetical protein
LLGREKWDRVEGKDSVDAIPDSGLFTNPSGAARQLVPDITLVWWLSRGLRALTDENAGLDFFQVRIIYPARSKCVTPNCAGDGGKQERRLDYEYSTLGSIP